MTSDTYDADALGSLDPDGAAERAPSAGQPSVADNAPTSEDEAAQVLTDIDALQRERDGLLEMSQRLQADFENYRKRVLREQTALVERATETLVEQLLPALDSFELALESLEGADEKVHKGMELVRAQLRDVLTKAGLSEIEAQGRPFDPTVHEAVAQEGDDGDGDPHVAEILRMGYRLKGRVLRPAMVRVTRAG